MANIRKTAPSIDREFSRSRLKSGDILLSIRGTVGRLIVIPPEFDGANITQDSARLSIQPHVNRDFVLWYLRSDGAQQRMRNAVKGVAVRGINIGDVRALQVPIPSLDEQHEIVRRVGALFAYANRLELSYGAANRRVLNLTSSMLAKAFRGELVPQDPNDEPASALLERIRTGREAAASEPKVQTRRKAMTQKTSKKKQPARPIAIANAIRDSENGLSGGALLTAAGYPGDAGPEEVEAFFVAVREALESNQITRERRDDEDWFSLAGLQETHQGDSAQ